jgi:hypothetical protein
MPKTEKQLQQARCRDYQKRKRAREDDQRRIRNVRAFMGSGGACYRCSLPVGQLEAKVASEKALTGSVKATTVAELAQHNLHPDRPFWLVTDSGCLTCIECFQKTLDASW